MARDVCTTPTQPVDSSELHGMSPAALPGPLKPLLRGVLHEYSVAAAVAAGTMLVLSASTPEVLTAHSMRAVGPLRAARPRRPPAPRHRPPLKPGRPACKCLRSGAPAASLVGASAGLRGLGHNGARSGRGAEGLGALWHLAPLTGSAPREHGPPQGAPYLSDGRREAACARRPTQPAPAQASQGGGLLARWAVHELHTAAPDPAHSPTPTPPAPAQAKAACGVYVASLTALFLASALYHRRTWTPRARLLMKRVDHAAIFVLIAGAPPPARTGFSLWVEPGRPAHE
jgi:hypothetical protein